MTYEEAKAKAEEKVFVYYTAGTIMYGCEKRGFKFRKTKAGNFAGGERTRCELFLIDAIAKELVVGSQ